MFKKRGSGCLKNVLQESSECINYDMLVKLAASGRNKRKTTIKILVYWKLLGKSKICFSTSQMVEVTFLLFGGDVSPGFRVHRPQPEVWRQRSPPWSQCCSLRRPKSYTPEEEKNTKNAKKKKRKERMRVCMYVYELLHGLTGRGDCGRGPEPILNRSAEQSQFSGHVTDIRTSLIGDCSANLWTATAACRCDNAMNRYQYFGKRLVGLVFIFWNCHDEKIKRGKFKKQIFIRLTRRSFFFFFFFKAPSFEAREAHRY